MAALQPIGKRHPYEDPEYWSKRSSLEGVATLGWSPRINKFYYDIKERRLVNWLNEVPRNGSILEVGCGVGRIGRFIKRVRPDVKLFGADFSGKMLSVARDESIYQNLFLGDICALPFATASFDLVLAMDVLYHVVRPYSKGLAWSELARVARKESGVFAYGTGYEITSLVVIDRLVNKIFPFLFGQKIKEGIIVFLTKRCDSEV